MKNDVNILFAADERFAPLLLIAIKSLLQNCSSSERLKITVFDRGITAPFKEALVFYTKQAVAELQFIDVRREILRETTKTIPDSFFSLPDTGHYDRLLAPILLESDRLLYLDSDILIQGDVIELWNTPLRQRSISAVEDEIIPTIGSDFGIIDFDERQLLRSQPYFNSGVMLIDLAEWRRSDVAPKCFECVVKFIKANDAPPPLHDQFALNVVFYNVWNQLDAGWNCFAQNITRIVENQKIIHFAGGYKPVIQTGSASGSSKYYGRMAQRLIEDDLTEIRKTEQQLQTLQHRHDSLKILQENIKTPNGNKLTFATAYQLSMKADRGNTVIVIPLMVTSIDSKRYRNFCFLLNYYSKVAPHLVIVEQTFDSTRGEVAAAIFATGAMNISHLEFEIPDKSIHKARLINEGAAFAIRQLEARYIWQIDADILIQAPAVLNQLRSLHSEFVPVIRPLFHFIRLDERRSSELLNKDIDGLQHYNPNLERVSHYQIIDLFGPGSVIFSRSAFQQTGGLEESYTGWGWEDMDFAAKLAQISSPHSLPNFGVHLHHEEDRIPNLENFDQFFEGPDADVDVDVDVDVDLKRHTLVHTTFHNFLTKFCIISSLSHEDIIVAFENSEREHPILLSKGPVEQSSLPKGNRFSQELEQKIIYTLGTTKSRIAGFHWNVLEGECFDPSTNSEIPGERLIHFLVANQFLIFLMEGDSSLMSAKEALTIARIKALLKKSCSHFRLQTSETIHSISIDQLSTLDFNTA